MLPGLRLVAAAIAAAVLVIVLGIAALARLQAAHDSVATLPPPEARLAGLAFAERADWTPDFTTRRVSLESLPPFAKSPTTFNPPKLALAAPAVKVNKPAPNIVIAINPAPLDLTPGPIPIVEPAAAPPPAAMAIEARAELSAVKDEPLRPERMRLATLPIPEPTATAALPPDISTQAVEVPQSAALSAIPLPADRPGIVGSVTRPVARRRMPARIRTAHIKTAGVRRPTRTVRRPAPPQQPPASAAATNPFAALFGGLRPTGAK